MALTNRQIERYSRQLIVPNFGGVAQERLLAAHVLLHGDHADTSMLAYLVGAGVGRIDLRADLDSVTSDAIVARMRDLNPDSTVRIAPRVAPERATPDRDLPNGDRTSPNTDLGDFGQVDLALVLADDDATLDQARAFCDRRDHFAANLADDSVIVLARFDQPARIAVIPRRPPCPRCASVGDLLAPIDRHAGRADNAAFIANLAALEAIKLLAQFNAPRKPTLIEFRGYEVSARTIDSAPGSACACITTAEKP